MRVTSREYGKLVLLITFVEHDVHFKVKTQLSSDEWDGNLLVGRYSSMDIVKSKFSPEFSNIPIYLDITQGGSIDEVRSFVDYLINLGLIPNCAGYYKIEDTLAPMYKYTPYYYESILPLWKSFRYNKLIEIAKSDDHLVDFLMIALMEYLGDRYHLQRKVMEDYLNEIKDRYESNSSRFEYSIYREPEYLPKVLQDMYTNQELLAKLVDHDSSESPNPVCIACGQVLEYHEPCKECKGDYTVSKSTLKYVMCKYDEEYTPVNAEVSE